MMELGGERMSTMCLAVFTQYQSVTDRQNCYINIARCTHERMRTISHGVITVIA